MASRVVATVMLVVGVLVATVVAASGDRVPGQQSAVVRFEHRTWVANEILIGTYVIVHDDSKMARGEPCTSFYRVASTSPLEAVVAFHCIPRERKAVPSFTTVVSTNAALGVDTLTEYQFPGESEGHGVPVVGFASDADSSATAGNNSRCAPAPLAIQAEQPVF